MRKAVFRPSVVLLAILAYMGVLFVVALVTERAARKGYHPSNHPVVYSLSLAVYCTTWTYYGSVGKAATSGLVYLAIYMGPTLALVFGWLVVRRMVLIKTNYHVPSIADLISVRYGKSQSVASLVTIIALVGVTPYIALQLKAILSTFELLVTDQPHVVADHLGLFVVGLMTVFTIVFGVRRIDPTERHQGVVMAVAVESIVKLVAFLAVGTFVTFGMFDGFGDIAHRFTSHPQFAELTAVQNTGSSYLVWMSYLVLSMSAFLFLPRQFHVAVVESFELKHIRTSMWMFPVYMLLINIFVFPIALAGLITGKSIETADTFVLQLPLEAGEGWLSLLVFLGGFSAAMAMIMVCSLSLSTMVSNHLLTPLFEKVQSLGFLRSYLLQCRWFAVGAVILIGYGFEIAVGESYLLVSMGIISFAAVLQFAPAVIGGLFWERGTRTGALAGMAGGFAVWFYTLLLPTFVKSGWVGRSLLDEGPFGIRLLAPEQLLGVTVLDPVSHAVFWSLLVNVALFVGASCVHVGSERERALAREFFDAVAPKYKERLSTGGIRDIKLKPKLDVLRSALEQYLSPSRAREVMSDCLSRLRLERATHINILEFTRLCSAAESALAGAIGTPAAHSLFAASNVYTRSESETLSEVYAQMLAALRIPPEELQRRIGYYKEREVLLADQAAELASQVELYQAEIQQRRLVEEALRESEAKFRNLFDSAPEGIAITGLDGTLHSCNAAFLRMFRIESAEAAKQLNVKSFYRDADRDRPAIIARVRQDGPVESFEPEMVDRTGRVFPANLSARLIQYEGQTCFLSIIRDVTRINEMEARLRDYAENLKRMVDEKTQALQTANEELSAAVASLEETREQLGRSAHQAGMAEIAVSVLHNIGNAVTWINVRAHGLEDHTGIREVKNLGRIQTRLTQLEALANGEQARERAQLLEFMRANTELLQRRRQNLETDLRYILNGMSHIMEIISVQQKYVGLAGEETRQDLNELVRDAAEMLIDSLEKRQIELQFDLHHLPEVELNRSKMIQILTNIIKNAYEAIDMAATAVKRIVISTSLLVDGDNEIIQVAVTDTGIGVDEAKRDSLFRFGFSTKERGTGYGLHDAANYVRARHGSIDLISEGIGRGSRVVIRLPARGKST
jgi:PAS domain S-box-containing protein